MSGQIDLTQILQRPEDWTLDFKQECYDLTHNAGKAAFAKDLASLANTPREGDAYLVLGVAEPEPGVYEVVGISNAPGDPNFQGVARSWLDPCPAFVFHTEMHNGYRMGVITIQPGLQRPVKSRRNSGGKVRRGNIYIRRGSTNEEANDDEVSDIWKWIHTGSPPAERPNPFIASPTWERYLESVNHLSTVGARHILVVAPHFRQGAESLHGIGVGPWSAVIDFNPVSETEGLLSDVKDELVKWRDLKLRTKGDPAHTIDLSLNSTTWYFANGLEGRSESIPPGPKKRDWNRAYGKTLEDELREWAAQLNPQETFVTVLWEGDTFNDRLDAVLDRIESTFDGGTLGARFAFVSPDRQSCDAEAERFSEEVDVFEMELHHFAQGVAQIAGAREEAHGAIFLPTSAGVNYKLDAQEARWIADDVDLVGVGIETSDDEPDTRTFLRGGEISWLALDLQKDAKRSITSRLEDAIKSDLGAGDLPRRLTRRLSLFHRPGAGGTTVARRIAWDLHEQYPVGLLRRTRAGRAEETVKRLARITQLTGKAMLVVADGADVSDRNLDEVFERSQRLRLPVVFLHVRRQRESQRQSERTYDLKSTLDPSEIRRFHDVLVQDNPKMQPALDGLVRGTTGRRPTPVFFALTAYEEEFLGLESFVSARLDGLQDDRREALRYLAIADFFGQQPIPASSLRSVLNLRTRDYADLGRLFGADTAELIIPVDDEQWRIGHTLIAEELLKQLLARSSDEDPRAWVNSLADTGIRFIAYCRGHVNSIPGEDMRALVEAVIVRRDSREILGTEQSGQKQFSRFIETVPNLQGRERVLNQLVAEDMFPSEHHFWLHLCRFLWMEQENFDLALDAADRAVQLSAGRDHVVLHSRGMVYRGKLYRVLDEYGVLSEPQLGECIEIAECASADFAESRQLDPGNEHGYISEIQMLITLLQRASGRDSVLEYIWRRGTPAYLRDAVDRVEQLLEDVRHLREGREASEYERRQSVRLEESVYGNFDEAIRILNDMLSREDVYAPPIRRQLSRTYVNRVGRDWTMMSSRQVERVVSLLRDNIVQEGWNDHDLRMWVQGVRFLASPLGVGAALEQVEYWRAQDRSSIDATYYAYALNVLLALGGDWSARDRVERLVNECRGAARDDRTRRISYEWLGEGEGVGQLVNAGRLGEWRGGGGSEGFWENEALLRRVQGRVVRIQGGQAGELEVEGGLSAFFIPGIVSPYELVAGRDENRLVTAYLGFSYDGLRAFAVRMAD